METIEIKDSPVLCTKWAVYAPEEELNDRFVLKGIFNTKQEAIRYSQNHFDIWDVSPFVLNFFWSSVEPQSGGR